MSQLHCTKKFLDRVKPSALQDVSSDGLLGNWCSIALFWKPQVALLVNEKTLLPVLMPLAPATDLGIRFPVPLADVRAAHGVPQQFIDHELAHMNEVQYCKNSSRSVVGIINQFTYLVDGYREYFATSNLRDLALKLAHVLCSPLYKSETLPDRELKLLVVSSRFAV